MSGSTSGFAAGQISWTDLTPPIASGERWDPRRDRHAVNLRWLLATSLIAVLSAVLLTATLRSALNGTAKPEPASYALMEIAGAVDGTGRANRLAPPEPEPARRNVQVRVEAVRSSGSSVVPLTFLIAHLGRDAPTEAPAPGPKPQRDGPAPAESAGVSASIDEDLPPEILLGASASAKAPGLAASTAPPAYAAQPGFHVEPGPRGTPLNVTVVPGSRHVPEQPDRVVVAQKGDELATMLPLLGFSADEVGDLTAALAGVAPFQGGETIAIRPAMRPDPGGSDRPVMVRLEGPDGAVRVAARSDAGRYEPVRTPSTSRPGVPSGLVGDASDSDSELPEHGTIKDSLLALAGHGVADQPLVDDLLRLSGSDLDLGEPVGPDDITEMLYGPPRPDSADPVLDFAALTVGGRTRRYYRFEADDDGSTDFYDPEGHSVTRFLLRKPVANGRLGDGFGWRTHPVLGDRRFHQGVDYAAPYGSPVVAAGAGVVEKIDSEWGYGKYIRVRHDLGYETTYAHVSGFAKDMRIGERVRQGETIAYIGSTGLSTGPHLYYEVRINDHNVDPLRIRLSGGRILGGEALQAFERRRDRIDVLVKVSASGVTGQAP